MSIQSTQPNTYVLTGRTSEVGEHTFEIAVKLGHEEATQTFTLSVRPLITLTGGDEISGWKGEPVGNSVLPGRERGFAMVPRRRASGS